MSDISRAPSNKSPASSTSTLPLVIPNDETHIIDINKEVEYFVSSPSPSIQQVLNSARPIFPNSGLNLLEGHAQDPRLDIAALARGLRQGFENQLAEAQLCNEKAQQENLHLKGDNQKKAANIRHLNSLAALTPQRHQSAPQPKGFEINEKYAQLVVPHYGYRAKAHYVQVSPTNPSLVEATMGKNDDRYSFPIYAKPWRPSTIYDDQNTPTEPLPEWFLILLQGDSAHYQIFANGVKEINDWEVAANIAHYRELTKHIDKLCRTREGINLLLASACEKCDLVQY